MLRLIKKHGKEIGFRGKVAMMDETQQEKMIRAVMADMKKSKTPMKELRAQLKVGPEIFMGKAVRTYNDLELIAQEYYQRLMSASLLDFDSLLKFGLLVIRKLRAQGIACPFTYLFWDEFQDSGNDDANILAAFDCENNFVVGDPDQSIYSFRGGDPTWILGMSRGVHWSVKRLDDNYRCDEAITATANKLIRHNTDRIEKDTVSRTGLPGKVWTFRADVEGEEIRQIAEDINAQPNPSECAVLVRYNPLADRIGKALEAHGIQVSRKEATAKPDDWKTARALVNLFANPDNDHLAYWFLETAHDKRFADKAKLAALGAFTSINRHILKLPEDMPLTDVPTNLAKSGIKPESLALIGTAIAGLNEGATLAELSFSLGDDDLHRNEVGQGVTVTTMHAAKGREWDTVYLPAFEENIIPTNSKRMILEEERRLAFVAITRARHRLLVSFSKTRKPLFGGYKPESTTPSRFVEEIRRAVNNQ
jgi:DNA helicase-2/ATP-dependent DNA helicase PcrA